MRQNRVGAAEIDDAWEREWRVWAATAYSEGVVREIDEAFVELVLHYWHDIRRLISDLTGNSEPSRVLVRALFAALREVLRDLATSTYPLRAEVMTFCFYFTIMQGNSNTARPDAVLASDEP